MAVLLNDFSRFENSPENGPSPSPSAAEESFDPKVLIKEIDPGLLGGRSQIQLLEQEIQFARLLDHDNIVKMYDYGKARGLFCVMMEYVDGPSLRQMFAWEPFRKEIGLMIALQAISGLHYAHQHSIIHRNFNPDNILISRAGLTKVLNFGFSKSPFRPIGYSGSVPISIASEYIAPERMATGTEPHIKEDVWAAGVLLHRILFGNSNGAAAGRDNPPQVPGISQNLADSITACLIKDPQKRLASLAPIIESLRTLFKEMGISNPSQEIKEYILDNIWRAQKQDSHFANDPVKKRDGNQILESKLESEIYFEEATEGEMPAFDLTLTDTELLETRFWDAPIAASSQGVHSEAAAITRERDEPRSATSPFLLFLAVKRRGAAILTAAVSAIVVSVLIFGPHKSRPLADQSKLYAPESQERTLKDEAQSVFSMSQVVQPAEDSNGHSKSNLSSNVPASGPAPDLRPEQTHEFNLKPISKKPVRLFQKVASSANRHSNRAKTAAMSSGPDDLGAIRKPDSSDANSPLTNATEPVPEQNTLNAQPHVASPNASALKPADKGNGLLHIYSSPWSEIYVDDNYQGTAPSARPIALSEGEHRLKLQRDGFKPYSVVVTITSGEMKRIQVTLEKATTAAASEETTAQ